MQIGGSVGRVLEVDVADDGIGWGKSLRVKVEVPLQKAIAGGRFLNVKGNKLWVHFKHEKLPKICFKCGGLWLHDEVSYRWRSNISLPEQEKGSKEEFQNYEGSDK